MGCNIVNNAKILIKIFEIFVSNCDLKKVIFQIRVLIIIYSLFLYFWFLRYGLKVVL